ncbi:hypothetical protein BG006_005205, partial [Podila minutissima]
MVPANNGTKLIVFGPHLLRERSWATLESLTSPSQHGPEARIAARRVPALGTSVHVCALSRDKFVTWGGQGALTASNPSKME